MDSKLFFVEWAYYKQLIAAISSQILKAISEIQTGNTFFLFFQIVPFLLHLSAGQSLTDVLASAVWSSPTNCRNGATFQALNQYAEDHQANGSCQARKDLTVTTRGGMQDLRLTRQAGFNRTLLHDWGSLAGPYRHSKGAQQDLTDTARKTVQTLTDMAGVAKKGLTDIAGENYQDLTDTAKEAYYFLTDTVGEAQHYLTDTAREAQQALQTQHGMPTRILVMWQGNLSRTLPTRQARLDFQYAGDGQTEFKTLPDSPCIPGRAILGKPMG